MSRKRRDPNELTIREKIFVKEVARTGDPTSAALTIGKPKDRKSAAVIASTMMARPIVKAGITAELNDLFPNRHHLTATVLKQLGDRAIAEDASSKEKSDFVKLMNELEGYAPPKRTQNLSVKLDTRTPWQKPENEND